MLLLLAASLPLNFFFYREATNNYRRISEVELDPYGLRHPAYPSTQGSDGAGHWARPAIVLLGDSRARGWRPPEIEGYQFINRGIVNQTTAQVLGRYDAHVAPLSPRVVVVEAGVNDLKAIPLFRDRRAEIVANCESNLQEMVSRATGQGATVILATIFPTGHVPMERRLVWSPDIEKAVEEVNDRLRALASDRVIVLDAWKLLEQNGQLREGYGVDTLHLNAAGYAVLNAELVKILKARPFPPGTK